MHDIVPKRIDQASLILEPCRCIKRHESFTMCACQVIDALGPLSRKHLSQRTTCAAVMKKHNGSKGDKPMVLIRRDTKQPTSNFGAGGQGPEQTFFLDF